MIPRDYFKSFHSIFIGYLIIILFSFNSCDYFDSSDDSQLRKLVIKSSLDDNVDQKDKERILKFLNENSKYDNFSNLSKSNDLLDKKIREISKKPNLEIWDPDVTVAPKLGKIRFYIETSMSMGGYLNGGTEFQNTVNYLIGDLRQGFNTINFVPNIIGSHITSFEDVDNYADNLTNSSLSLQGFSPLQEAFSVIIDSSGPNDINFFATDGIMSGSNNQIKHNPNFNIEYRSRLLTSIKACFEDVKDTFGLSVYAFQSNFNADVHKGYVYYTYNNTRIARNFDDRPFYIFVFGNKYLMDSITNYIANETEFVNPIKELHFGLNEHPIRSYALFNANQPFTIRNCMFPTQRTVKCNVEPSDQYIVHFAVGLNLSKLPPYAQDLDYLNRNLDIGHSNNITLSHDVFHKIDENFIKPLHPTVQKVILQEGCTHYVDIYLNNMFSPKEIINLIIKKEEDKWYENWSCDNDQNIRNDTNLQDKTFNFKYMIYGMRDAFRDEDNINFVDVKITIINY